MRTNLIKILIKVVTISCVLGLVFGCANTNIQIKNVDLAAINGVMIDKNVVVPDEPYVEGGSSAIQFFFITTGAIGEMAKDADTDKASTQFQKYLEHHNIRIADIVYDSFCKNISKNITGNTAFKLKAKSNTTLYLQVDSYGFAASSGWIWKYKYRKPMIRMTAALQNKDSRIIWQCTRFINSESYMVSDEYEHTYEEFAKNPHLVKGALQHVADLVAKEILIDLHYVDDAQ